MPRYPYERVDPDLARCPVVGLEVDTAPATAATGIATGARSCWYMAAGSVTLYFAERICQLTPLQPPGCRPACRIARSCTGASPTVACTEPSAFAELPDSVQVLEVGPLMRELILRMTGWAADLQWKGRT